MAKASMHLCPKIVVNGREDMHGVRGAWSRGRACLRIVRRLFRTELFPEGKLDPITYLG